MTRGPYVNVVSLLTTLEHLNKVAASIMLISLTVFLFTLNLLCVLTLMSRSIFICLFYFITRARPLAARVLKWVSRSVVDCRQYHKQAP